jgi:hypothetical protein
VTHPGILVFERRDARALRGRLLGAFGVSNAMRGRGERGKVGEFGGGARVLAGEVSGEWQPATSEQKEK